MPPEDTSTSLAQEPQPADPQPAPATKDVPIEAPTPTEEAPAQTPETPIEVAANESEAESLAPEPETAQIPPNEPLPSESEPITSTPEPPSAAAPVPTAQTYFIRDLLSRARIAIQDRKRKKRDKIMQALNTRNKITNDEVEKLLRVSDATATRYLSALEKEGKIKQIGKTGHGVVYSKI